VTVLEEHTSGTPCTPHRWYTPGKFWYTLGCTIHPVDKHCSGLHSIFPKCTTSCVVVFDGRVTRVVYDDTLGLPDAFCKNTGHFELSSVPDLSCVKFRKRHRVNREIISIVKPQLIICPYFCWLITCRCV